MVDAMDCAAALSIRGADGFIDGWISSIAGRAPSTELSWLKPTEGKPRETEFSFFLPRFPPDFRR
jgi:hypothetical protein